MVEQPLETPPVAGLEAGIVRPDAEEPAGPLGKHDGRRYRGYEDEAKGRGVDIRRQFAPTLTRSSRREVFPTSGAVVGWRVIWFGETSPDEQAQGARIGQALMQITADDVADRLVFIAECFFALEPGLLDGEVEALFASEVIRDKVFADSGTGGDVAHRTAGESLRGELLKRSVQERRSTLFAVDPSFLRPRSTTSGGTARSGRAGHDT